MKKQFDLVYLQGLELRLLGRSNNRIDIFVQHKKDIFLFLKNKSRFHYIKKIYAQNKNVERLKTHRTTTQT